MELIWSLQDESFNAGTKIIKDSSADEDAEFGGVLRTETYTTVLTAELNQKTIDCRVRRKNSGLECFPFIRNNCVLDVQCK